MICPECNTEKGCGCSFFTVPGRQHKVCGDCKTKLADNPKNDKNVNQNAQPNVQGV